MIEVGGESNFDLRYIGKMAGCEIYANVAGKVDKSKAVKQVLAILFNAFGPKESKT